ncbi:hypothetical protein [uncultured Winogradskyella sp.]|uniref:hypothetical protein n=1 Tax=uncultured Winogradskyella sp. TaxID=395353 RepID=UPI002639C12E|nr:hypothetical protein [uncultured Winogradskyella sp.]
MEKETVYLLFDKQNKEQCLIEDGSGNSKYTNKYRKEYWSNGNIINFRICNERFTSHRTKSSIDTCSAKALDNIKLVDFDYLQKKYDSVYEFKHHVFEKIYFIEKISEDKIIKYEVNWVDSIMMIQD